MHVLYNTPKKVIQTRMNSIYIIANSKNKNYLLQCGEKLEFVITQAIGMSHPKTLRSTASNEVMDG